MNRLLCILAFLAALSSCVRDDIPSCPNLSIQVDVKDKNYFNVHKVDLEEPRSEDLAFREYVPTVYYQLRVLETGELVMEHALSEVAGDEKTYHIQYCEKLPHGTYVLTVWGGMKDMASLDAARTSITLHPGGVEGDDVYMACDTLVYDAYHYDYTVEMERTKGKLLVQTDNLPQDIAWGDKTVSGLYGTVDNTFSYSDSTSVCAEWGRKTAGETVVKTMLSPSHDEGAMLKVNFYDSPARAVPAAVPDDVKVTMRRNELTVLKYVYDDGRFSVYILVNDNWEKVHGMVID